MTPAELIKERRALFDNAIAFRHNKRVPLFANYWTWKFLDAGYRMDEAITDYAITEKAMRHFIETYQFDSYTDLGTRNPLRLTNAVGGGWHKVDPTGEFMIVEDHQLMQREDYDELIAQTRAGDTNDFYWQKLLPVVCRKGVTVGEIINGVKELMAFDAYTQKMLKVVAEEYGALCNYYNDSPAGLNPYENLFNTLRGIKETSRDIRKCKDKVKEFIDANWEIQYPQIKADMEGPRKPTRTTDSMSAMLGHSVLSVKQFGELYWPYMKATIDLAYANGKTMFFMCEAEVLRFAEYLEEIPKGVVMFQLEQDDVFEFRKRLPNIAICGGMPANLLGNGTKEQCVDYAKYLVDELGEGYIFSTDKMMSFRVDAKGENVKAVNDFLLGYSL